MRRRTGGILWAITIVYLVAQPTAALGWTRTGQGRPYSWTGDCISDLGAVSCTGGASSTAVCSPWHAVMDAGFVITGLLGLAGLRTRPALGVWTLVCAVASLIGAGLFFSGEHGALGTGGAERLADYPFVLWVLTVGFAVLVSKRIPTG